MTSRPHDVPRLDVDARFLLANERTLLAWERTALALIAGGVATHELGSDLRGQTALAVGLLVGGLMVALTGAVRHRRADRSLRSGELPRNGVAPYAVAALVALIALVEAVAVVLAG